MQVEAEFVGKRRNKIHQTCSIDVIQIVQNDLHSFMNVSWKVLHGSERERERERERKNIINLLYELERETLNHGPRQAFVHITNLSMPNLL